MSTHKEFGRFEISDVLGRGGMGTVYRALDPVIGRTVAIKEIAIQSNLSENEKAELKARYELEFRAAGRLTHPNVVTIYDVGQSEGSYFIAMELVEGKTLADSLVPGEPMDPSKSLDLARQIAAGIDYAHQHGIVHRDIKPGNVLLTNDGRAKITDFGLVKMQMLASQLTQAGTVLGTPAYMSPEQVLGRPVDLKTDQFSFAVLLYQMLTGDIPFQADHPSAILYKIVNEQPLAPAERNTGLPDGVDLVLLRALAKDPVDRFSSCTELVEALSRAFEKQEPNDAILQPPTRSLDGASYPEQAKRGASWLKWLAAAACLVALAAGGYFASSRFQTSLEPASLSSSTEPSDAATISSTVSIVAPVEAELWIDGTFSTEVGPGAASTIHLDGNTGEVRTLEIRVGEELLDRFEVTLDGELEKGLEWRPELPEIEARLLSITSSPSGATVLVDGAQLEQVTPTQLTVEAEQVVSLRLQLEGYETAGWSFSLGDLSAEQDRTSSLHFPLASSVPPGILVVESDYQVEVRIGNRRESGTGTLRIELEPGEYRAELVAAEVFLRHAYPVAIQSGIEHQLIAPKAVPVLIAATPANCRVSIDGSFVDVTPINDRRLVLGRHDFVFEWPAQGEQKSLQVNISRPNQRIFEALE